MSATVSAAWADICAELITEFPAMTERDVIAIVAEARAATDLFGLVSTEQRAAIETIARNNIEILLSGTDLARLDPETHSPRRHDP